MQRWMGMGVGLMCVALAGCGGQGVVSYGTITTVAGTGTQGYSGDGAAATAAKLNSPTCVAVDGAGNIYATDAGAHVVRRVSAAGTISTYAGTGTAGYTGDSGPAAAAQLNSPSGCVLDGAGNLYIADSGNNVVRKITAATGVITTVAGTGYAGYTGEGGPPILSSLNNPYGVALDAAGNLYIGDTQNYRVRKVDFGANTIVTVAGTGAYGYSGDGGAATKAQLYNPEGLVVLSNGDIVVADEANSVVRRITASTGNIATIAGNNRYGFTGDGYGATGAQLNDPSSIAVDSAGNIYFTDTGNMRVRRITPAGTIATVAGSGDQGFKGDTKAASDAQLDRPRGVTITAAGVMYIADTGNGAVRKVQP